jgi:hypothetical protein
MPNNIFFKKTSSHDLIAALFIIVRRENTQGPSTDAWKNNTLEYYLTIKNKEVPVDPTTWITLEHMLSKNDSYSRLHFI